MRRSNLVRFAAVAAMATSGIAIPATAAMAVPSGCSQTISAFGLIPTGEIIGQMSGSCGTNKQRTLKGEIKEDRNLRPDRLVLEGADTDQRNYLVAVQGCDDNRTANYYARVFYTSDNDYSDTDPKRIDVC